jgi:PAS domain S-box-containing protein
MKRPTKKKRAEQTRPEEELSRFFALSLDMLCIAGFDGYFKRLNPAWEKTLGYNLDELLARPYLELVHPQDRESTIAEAQKLTTGRDTICSENRYLCKDGSYKWLSWSSTPLPEQKLIYAVARDVTGRKRAEEEIRRLNVGLGRRVVERTAQLDGDRRGDAPNEWTRVGGTTGDHTSRDEGALYVGLHG